MKAPKRRKFILSEFTGSPTNSSLVLTSKKQKSISTTYHSRKDSLTKSHRQFGLTKTSSQRTIDECSSCYSNSKYDNYEYNIEKLKKKLLSFQRTKSQLPIKPFKGYDNFHKKLLKKKLNKNYANFFLTLSPKEEKDSTSIFEAKQPKEETRQPEVFSQRLPESKTHRFFPTFMTGITAHKNTLSTTHQDFINECKTNFRCSYLLNVRKATYINKIEEDKISCERCTEIIYLLQRRKNLLLKYVQSFNEYLKFLRNIISVETEKLHKIIDKEDEIHMETKILFDKVTKQKHIGDSYNGVMSLIKFCCQSDNPEKFDFEEFLIMMKAKERKILSLIEKQEENKEEIKALKKELSDMKRETQISEKKEEKEINEELIIFNMVKKKYETLLNNKEILLHQESDIYRNKKNEINEIKQCTVVNNNRFADFMSEIRMVEVLKKNNLNYTGLALMVSRILGNLIKNIPHYVTLHKIENKIQLTMKDLEEIMNIKYTVKNYSTINFNILTMLKVIERTAEKIYFEIQKKKLNPKNLIIISKEKQRIENDKKIKGIQLKKQTLDKIRKDMLENVILKQKKINYVLRRKVDEQFFVKKIAEKEKKKKNKNRKSLTQIQSEENIELLLY